MNNNKEITTKQRVIVVKDVFRVENNNKIKKFNGYHAIAYAGAQLFYNVIAEQSTFTVGMLSTIAGIEDSRTKNNIKKAVIDLEKWGLIAFDETVDEKINNNSVLMIKIPQINGKTSKFTTINHSFVSNILKSNYSVQEKGNMILIYMVLAQYMGNQHSAFPSMGKIGEDTLLTKPTIISAINNLVEMDILYYGNYGYKVDENNQVRKHNNIYIFRDTKNADLLYKKIAIQEKEIKEQQNNEEKECDIDQYFE